LEDGEITITRVDGNITLPARFMLVAASNPCPCGYCGDDKIPCTCAPPQIHAYQNRIGGPLIDRIDMCIDVWRSDFEQVVQGDTSIDSAKLRAGVQAGREFAAARRCASGDMPGRFSTKELMRMCLMDAATMKFFKGMSEAYVLSGRGIARTLSVARTIADIEQSAEVKREHLAEALNMRVRSRTGRR
jgi:magnesium chelatase family protein